MISGLTISRASLRFEEGGLTQQLLAFFGRTAEAHATAARRGPSVRRRGRGHEAQPLSTAILQASSTYLSNPWSLAVTLAPASPVPAGAVLLAAEREPEKLVRIPGASVRAND